MLKRNFRETPGKNSFEYAEGSQRVLGHLRHSGTQALEALGHSGTKALERSDTQVSQKIGPLETQGNLFSSLGKLKISKKTSECQGECHSSYNMFSGLNFSPEELFSIKNDIFVLSSRP